MREWFFEVNCPVFICKCKVARTKVVLTNLNYLNSDNKSGNGGKLKKEKLFALEILFYETQPQKHKPDVVGHIPTITNAVVFFCPRVHIV